MAAIDVQAVQNLEKIAEMLLKMQGAHQKKPFSGTENRFFS